MIISFTSPWIILLVILTHSLDDNAKLYFKHRDLTVSRIFLLLSKIKIKKTLSFGSSVTFKPDNEIFEVHEFNYDTLCNRFREMSFLNKGLRIVIKDERTEKTETFHYEGGIKEFVIFLNRAKNPLHKKPIYFEVLTNFN